MCTKDNTRRVQPPSPDAQVVPSRPVAATHPHVFAVCPITPIGTVHTLSATFARVAHELATLDLTGFEFTPDEIRTVTMVAALQDRPLVEVAFLFSYNDHWLRDSAYRIDRMERNTRRLLHGQNQWYGERAPWRVAA